MTTDRDIGAAAARGGSDSAAPIPPGDPAVAGAAEPAAAPVRAQRVPERRRHLAGGSKPRPAPRVGTAHLTAEDLLHLDPVLLALAESERHFRTLIEQAADGILMVDATGRITLANGRACEMTGYAPDEIVGLELLDTYLPDEREVGRERVQKMPSGTTLRFQRELLRKDGTRMPIDVSVAWLPDGERQSIMRDITARMRGQETPARGGAPAPGAASPLGAGEQEPARAHGRHP